MKKYIEQLQGPKTAEITNWINTTLVAYLRKNPENQGEIEHILDFLQSDKAPTRLQKMSYEQAKAGAEKWVRALKKRGNAIMETEADTQTIFTFKSGARLVKLVSKQSYEREGALMSHCVGSYFGKPVEIYSLRDNKNQPHCTIELSRANNGQINQIKGKGNGSIHPRYVKAVITSLKKLGMPIRESELTYLGYTALDSVTPGLHDFVCANFKGAQFLTMFGKQYFYNYSRLEKKMRGTCEQK